MLLRVLPEVFYLKFKSLTLMRKIVASLRNEKSNRTNETKSTRYGNNFLYFVLFQEIQTLWNLLFKPTMSECSLCRIVTVNSHTVTEYSLLNDEPAS